MVGLQSYAQNSFNLGANPYKSIFNGLDNTEF